MKVVIGQIEYTELLNLNFSPEADIVCSSIPVNQFWCDIVTTDSIQIGSTAVLKDDLNQTWASYRVTSSERIDTKKVKLKASLDLSVLDETTLDSKMIGTSESLGVNVTSLLDEIFVPLVIPYTLYQEGFTNTMVKGFLNRQTCRERLLWLITAIGGYLSFSWGGGVEIRALTNNSPILIPVEKTFFKPSVAYKELVTGVKVTYYEYEERVVDPATDDYVVEETFTDGTDPGELIATRTVYAQIKKKLLIDNENAPADVPENIVEVDGVTVITPENVSHIATRLASKYFLRREIKVDVINNREYYPGQYVMVYLDESTIISGYIQSCAFKFGLQARSTLTLVGVTDVSVGGTITIRYMWYGMGTILETESIFPSGYSYTYTTHYLDKTINGHRYVFRPRESSVVIAVGQAAQTVTIYCDAALDYYEGVLHVLSVDSVDNYTGEEEENIVAIDRETGS